MAAPPFLFRIDELRPVDGVRQREAVNGDWLPPRPEGSNHIPANGQGHWLYNSGLPGRPSVVVASPSRDHVQHFKTFSMYHSDGTFWIAPNDASRVAIGPGTQHNNHTDDDDDDDDDNGGDSPASSRSSTDSDESESDNDARGRRRRQQSRPHRPTQVVRDWDILSFDRPRPDPGDYTSYATVRAETTRLHAQRRDQEAWINDLLPDRYHAPDERRQLESRSRLGGMVGELPILLGLIAFSVRPRDVEDTLRRCVHGSGWQRPLGPSQRRGSGWNDRRGLVIRTATYNAPRLPPSTVPDLVAFENGRRGKAWP